ncbi:beta and beta-prime subunits of DNA dependent RNA-polymerase [Anaeromyces robustus]|uniref:DNA-directed RNA polymerase subunit n=1 Tax=Anaeromyces robustus TaxID=1754192 RepID=A0A1Y1WQ63_9FUNG|nr:beta and beta-prime subunits of DNA dependent RNA-polymerase [Anaeromyces robustus]|eukprot:ORX75622.1 beta and beta-prime subunits of DNA dependent RNA-polymerase [Anaeromyces robustus]
MYLKFDLYTDEEYEKYGVLIKYKRNLTDNSTSYTLEPQVPCKQCKSVVDCPGHLGRIPLHHRIVHPIFINILCKEISRICPECKKYNYNNNNNDNNNNNNSLTNKNCCCDKPIPPAFFSLHKTKLYGKEKIDEEIEILNKVEENNEEEKENINDELLDSSKNKLKKEEKEKKRRKEKTISEYVFIFGDQIISIDEMYEVISSGDFSECPCRQKQLLNVFIKNIPVLPVCLRPSVLNPDNVTIHSSVTTLYGRILDLNRQYQNENPSLNKITYILRIFNMFRRILGIRSSTDEENDNKAYIKQMLSGKNGIFRNMCLAKRQNFCLRSVIIPNIDIPLDVTLLPKKFTDEIVPYGYEPGDYVIINRQPTLQTTSILAFRSYPADCQAIQVNPLVVSVFQADFDGDEMNIFWLSSEEAKKDMATKLNLANNIRSYKNGEILITFMQDTLTGLYNMTRDKEIVDKPFIKTICQKLSIGKKKWRNFCKYYKSCMNSWKIPYAHFLSVLLPKTLTLYDEDNTLLIDKGILVGVITGFNQMLLLRAIINYGDEFYLEFLWNVQRIIQEYNITHIITISIGDCVPSKELEEIFLPILESIPKELFYVNIPNIDKFIKSQAKNKHFELLCRYMFIKYYPLMKLVDSIDNNLTNIINSGSKGHNDNVVQMLMSVGVQAILPTIPIRNSYIDGLTAKELFIHSKSGRAGIISTSLNTSSSGYLQRELVKSMEDLVTDEKGVVYDANNEPVSFYPFNLNTGEIDDMFLDYAFSLASVLLNYFLENIKK